MTAAVFLPLPLTWPDRLPVATMSKYIPATDGQPTRHLSFRFKKSLRKKGLGLDHVTAAVNVLLPRLSAPVEAVLLADGAARAYVSFATVDDAVLAKNTMNGEKQEAMMGARVHVTFQHRVSPDEAKTRCSGIPDLATTADVVVPGLTVLEDFVTEEQESTLLSELGEGPWEKLIARRVRHFGYRFNYKTRKADPAVSSDEAKSGVEDGSDEAPVLPMSHSVVAVADAIAMLPPAVGVGFEGAPDQMTVNMYEPGQGIAPHVDTHSAFADGIMSLTLGAGTCCIHTCYIALLSDATSRHVQVSPW